MCRNIDSAYRRRRLQHLLLVRRILIWPEYVRAMFSCRPHPTVDYRPAGSRDKLAARFSCKQFRKIVDTSLVSLRIVYMVILHRSHGALSESGNSSITLRCRCSFDDLPEPSYATRIQSSGCPVEGDHDSFA
jgi:hypothetical protein